MLETLTGNHFEPRAAHDMATIDPPLLTGGRPTPLNFGNGSGDPIQFKLFEGQKSDVGFLRILVSTDYADLSDIAQEAPAQPETGSRALAPPEKPKVPAIWDAITLAVVQGAD
jgi:hypothetical protein